MIQNSKIAYIVVVGQVTLAVVCVSTICMSVFYKNYVDPSTLSALIVLTGTLVGNLGSILGGPRQMMSGPAKTEIVQPPGKPVPVQEAPDPTGPARSASPSDAGGDNGGHRG